MKIRIQTFGQLVIFILIGILSAIAFSVVISLVLFVFLNEKASWYLLKRPIMIPAMISGPVFILIGSYMLKNERIHSKIKELSIRDDLTALYNRFFFMDMGKRELDVAKRTEKPISLCMIDIDFFKNVNDNYGHQAGDKALISTANAISSVVSEVDIVARFGGEEFVVLLIDSTYEHATTKSEEIRKSVEANLIKLSSKSISLTVSIGISTLNIEDYDMTLEELINITDNALYYSKNSGRNCITHCNNISVAKKDI